MRPIVVLPPVQRTSVIHATNIGKIGNPRNFNDNFIAMKRSSSNGYQVIFWLLLPFLLAGSSWIYQYTGFLAGKAYLVKNYLQILGHTAILNTLETFTGAVTFYLSLNLVFPAIGLFTLRKFKVALYLMLLSVSPFLISAVFSFFSFEVYFSFRYYLFAAYVAASVAVILSGAATFFKRWLAAREKAVLLEKQALVTELALLRARTSPHFLFNTLNNIDSLISHDPEAASYYLNQLAGLLRYMLNEGAGDQISLTAEIDHIRKYIQLQQIRVINPEFVRFEVNGDAETHTIVPLLLVPVVENAFKYTTDRSTTGSIRISLILASDKLEFRCLNHLNGTSNVKEKGGLGLSIVRQRLALHYPDSHELVINDEKENYELIIKLKLHADNLYNRRG